MALIEFKNKPDTSTPISADNLNNNFNELNNKIDTGLNKNIIGLKSTLEQSGFTSNIQSNVILNEVDFQNGNKFTYQNNGVIIGEGISYIRVNYNVWVQTDANTYVWVQVYKNNVEMNQDIHDFKSETFVTMTNSVVFPVSQGDFIRLIIAFNNPSVNTKLPGNNYSRCVTMSIEEII